MKKFWKYIQAFLLLALMGFLFSFSSQRNAQREAGEVKVEFAEGQDLYITQGDIRGLIAEELKSGEEALKSEHLLHLLEQKLDAHPMIAKAEVYRTITNRLSVEVAQRIPLARVLGKPDYYIDLNGQVMPLSANHSARVPLISGIDQKDIPALFPLLKKIENQEFLYKNVVGIQKVDSENYILSLRGNPVKVNFGSITEIDRKIENFKVFYLKANEDSIWNHYSQINLKFINQVVGVKKEA